MNKAGLLRQLRAERDELEKSIAFWRAQPSIEISNGRGGMHDFRSDHLSMLEADLAGVKSALDVLEKPDA